jgi:hypothetical protein
VYVFFFALFLPYILCSLSKKRISRTHDGKLVVADLLYVSALKQTTRLVFKLGTKISEELLKL